MTRASGWTYRRRSVNSPPLVLGWVLMFLTLFLCCSPTATAAQHTGPLAGSAVRAFTPSPAAVAAVVVADAPDERGIGSSCHGATDHSTAVVLPGRPVPATPPCPSVAPPAASPTGTAAIRGPSDDGVGAVDHLRLQVQRV